MSIARTCNPRLYFSVYPDPDVPPWLVARISWDNDGVGASLELRVDLSARDQLRALAWASAVMPGYLWPDGGGFAGRGIGPVLPDRDLHRYGRAIRLVHCAECDNQFDTDTSDHHDLCWLCAEELERGAAA